MAIKKTHADFLTMLHEKNKSYRNKEFEVVSDYNGYNSLIVINDGSLNYNTTPSNLLRGCVPTFENCADKENYCLIKLEKANRSAFDKILKIKKLNKKITGYSVFSTIYGDIRVSLAALLRGTKVSTLLAVNKSCFFTALARSVRIDSDTIDYSNVAYKGGRTNVEFTCKKHNYIYSQRPSHHLNGVQGCVYCMRFPIFYSKDNFLRHSSFFKGRKSYLYIVLLEAETESFYKVGMTGEKCFESRMVQLKKHYNIEVLYKELGLSSEIFNLEQMFLSDFTQYRYTPNKKFSGHTECLTVNPLEYYYRL